MNFFPRTVKALFLERLNRFTLNCVFNGEEVKAFLPNPGRLQELLLPGVTVLLEKTAGENDKMPYVVAAIQKEGYPVMVHTGRTNDLANYLIGENLIPGLEGARVIKREIKHGRSRFDFLLRRGKEEVFLEVKSCTLAGRQVAMFPDAVTARGKRHLEELAELSGSNTAGAILFLIFWPQAGFFLPEYHTDLEFARTLYSVREKISIIPLAIELTEDLFLTRKVRVLHIPWHVVEREAADRGNYILILRLLEEVCKEIGKLGKVRFREGYYLYIGSAGKNLSKRIQRHRRTKKKNFWHLDSLRASAEFYMAFPIRTQDKLECEIAHAVKKISGWEVPRFGSSDCACDSHLYGMPEDPLKSPQFLSLLQYFRMDRLMGE